MTTWTNRGKLRVADGSFDAGNLTLALLTATPTDAAARDWNVVGDIVSEVTTGAVSNYVRTVLGSATITEDDTGDEVTIDYADTAMGALVAGASVTAVCAIRITTSEVMWVAALTGTAVTDGTAFTVVWPTTGAAYVDDV